MCTLQRVIGKHPSKKYGHEKLIPYFTSKFLQKNKINTKRVICIYHFSESYPKSNTVLTDLLKLKIIPIILATLLELHVLTFSILINLKSFLEHLKCLYN